jgi:hypothetical protein
MADKQRPGVTLDSLPGPALELVVKGAPFCRVQKLLLQTSRLLRDTVLAVTTEAQLCLDGDQKPADIAANQGLLRRLCKLASPGLQLELRAGEGGSKTTKTNLLEQFLRALQVRGSAHCAGVDSSCKYPNCALSVLLSSAAATEAS